MDRRRVWNIALVAAVVLLGCGGFSQGHQCWSEVPDNDTDCRAFRDFCYIFQPYHHNRSAVLVLDLRRPVADVLVRLRSADCPFRCRDARAAACNVSSQMAARPTRLLRVSQHFVKQHYAFHNIAGRYYCASVSLNRCGKLSDVIDTSTDSFEELGNVTVRRPVLLVESSQPVAVIAICVALTAGVVFMVAVYCIKTRLCSPRLVLPPPEKLPAGTDASAAVSPLLTSPAPAPPPAVLLLYSRDSDGFVRLMEAFRSLLAALTGLEVLDPLEPRRCVSEVLAAPAGWLWRQLRRRGLRVVLVVSAGALARQRALLRGQPPPTMAARPHPLDHLFTQALQAMHGDHRIAGDYRTVYKVRFEDITRTTETLLHIVPMRDFRLTRHIGHLVHELKGETHPPDIDEVAHSQELLRNHPEADNLLKILQELTV